MIETRMDLYKLDLSSLSGNDRPTSPSIEDTLSKLQALKKQLEAEVKQFQSLQVLEKKVISSLTAANDQKDREIKYLKDQIFQSAQIINKQNSLMQELGKCNYNLIEQIRREEFIKYTLKMEQERKIKELNESHDYFKTQFEFYKQFYDDFFQDGNI
jgi:hypothetical protein